MEMHARIRFDREIDVSKHYIDLGGFEMTFSNGLTVGFDFAGQESDIDLHDPTILDCEMYDLDTDCFEDSEFLKDFEGSVTAISDFYVYTGEDDDPEINPVELLQLTIINDNYKYIEVDDSLLGRIWDDKN